MGLEDSIAQHLREQVDTVMPYLVEKAVHHVVKEIKSTVSGSTNELWSASDIADYVGVSKNKVYQLTNNVNFPSRVVLPKDSGEHFAPKWYAKDVKTWVALHKKV